MTALVLSKTPNPNVYDYFENVNSLLNNTTTDLFIAIAFWGKGTDLIQTLTDTQKKYSDRKIQIICNLESGATNPKTIEEIMTISRVEIKSNPKLHSKFFVTDKELIIGSGNFSTDGIGLDEDEMTGWHEHGIRIQDESLAKNLKEEFLRLWENKKETHNITQADLKNAKNEFVKRRQSNACFSTSLDKLIITNPEKLKDRGILFAIYFDGMNTKEISRAKEKADENNFGNKLDYFLDTSAEGFKEWAPCSTPLILTQWNDNDTLSFDDFVITRDENYVVKSSVKNEYFLYADYAKNTPQWKKLNYSSKNLKKIIGKDLHQYITDVLKKNRSKLAKRGNTTFSFPLDDFLDWLQKQT